MITKRFSLYALTLLLSASALSAPVHAAPKEPELSFHPAKPWAVASSGADGVCGMTSEFNNGYVMRLMGANKAPRSIDINFQQDVFVAGKGYESTLTVPGHAPIRAFARAASKGTLSVNISGQKDFFESLRTGSVLDLDVEGNNFRFYMTGFTAAADNFDACLKGQEPQSAQAPVPTVQPAPDAAPDAAANVAMPAEATAAIKPKAPDEPHSTEAPVNLTNNAVAPPPVAPPGASSENPPANIEDLINESIAMEEQVKAGKPIIAATLPEGTVPVTEIVPEANPQPVVQPMAVRETIKLGDEPISAEEAKALQTSPAARRRMSEELAAKIARNPDLVSPRATDTQNPGAQDLTEPVTGEPVTGQPAQEAAKEEKEDNQEEPVPVLKTEAPATPEAIATSDAVEPASDEPMVIFNGQPMPLSQAKSTKASQPMPIDVKPADAMPTDAMTKTAAIPAQASPAPVAESDIVRRARALLARQAELDKAPPGSLPAVSPVSPVLNSNMPADEHSDAQTEMPALAATQAVNSVIVSPTPLVAPQPVNTAMAMPATTPTASPALNQVATPAQAADAKASMPDAALTESLIAAEATPAAPDAAVTPVASAPVASAPIASTPVAAPITMSKVTPPMIIRKESEKMDADFTDVGLDTPAPETIEPASNSYADAEPPARREIDPELLRKISDLESSLANMRKENEALSSELKASLEAGKTEQVSISNENWNLERATMRYNEAERELRRLGQQLQQERAQCMIQKQELETQLFDPRLTSQEQLAHLAELEQKLMAAEARIRELQGAAKAP